MKDNLYLDFHLWNVQSFYFMSENLHHAFIFELLRTYFMSEDLNGDFHIENIYKIPYFKQENVGSNCPMWDTRNSIFM